LALHVQQINFKTEIFFSFSSLEALTHCHVLQTNVPVFCIAQYNCPMPDTESSGSEWLPEIEMFTKF